jgi:hypothetical protein
MLALAANDYRCTQTHRCRIHDAFEFVMYVKRELIST